MPCKGILKTSFIMQYVKKQKKTLGQVPNIFVTAFK